MMKKTSKSTPSIKDLLDLVKGAKEAGVAKLKFGDFEAEFGQEPFDFSKLPDPPGFVEIPHPLADIKLPEFTQLGFKETVPLKSDEPPDVEDILNEQAFGDLDEYEN